MSEKTKRSFSRAAGILCAAAAAFVFAGCATTITPAQCAEFGMSEADCAAQGVPPTPLQTAASKGDEAGVKTLMSQGVNPGEVAPNGHDAISGAVAYPELARRLLEFCVASAAPVQKCPQALFSAAMIGDEAAAKALAAKGADIDAAAAPIQRNLSFRLRLSQSGAASASLTGMSMENIMAAAVAPGTPGDLANRRGIDTDNRALDILKRLSDEKKPAAPADASSAPGPAADGAAKPWWAK